MKNSAIRYLGVLFFLVCIDGYGQGAGDPEDMRISPEDIAPLVGEWEGSLTYIDYSSGKPYTMPANLRVEAGRNPYQLKINNIYPNEPKANGKSKFSISKDGTSINRKTIVSRETLPDGELEFQVEYAGKDGNENRKATIREIYVMGPGVFITRKEVRFLGEQEWIKRNEGSYRKKD